MKIYDMGEARIEECLDKKMEELKAAAMAAKIEAETGWISDTLDEVDVCPGSFTLEVSSPGMDRPLRRVRDFERFSGSQVSLQTTALEGRRRYTGKLLGIQENIVSLESDGMTYDIPLTEIKKCTLKPTFDFSGKNKN